MKLYLCVMENTKNNNIHNNQIIPLIKKEKNVKVLFIAPLFILNRKGFSINNQKYNLDNVYHIRIPLLSYNFSMNPLILPLFFIFSLPLLLLFIYKYDINKIHARNHLSSLLAVFIKKYIKKIIVLSDFRGLYAEEGVILRRWKFGSFRFKFWKYIERFICKESNIVTAISQNMVNYISETYNIKNIHFIPAVVDIKKFYFSKKLRSLFRKENNIKEDEIVFVYIGSFGLWHDIPSFYAYIDDYIKKYKIEKFRVFILSNINRKQYFELHNKFNTIISSVEPILVNKYLCGSDIGILPGTKKNGKEFDLMYKTMISSKLEEYLSSGLMVIANERIEEVHKLIKKDYNNEIFIHNDKRREEIAEKYQKFFSSYKIKSLYENLFMEEDKK